MRRAAVFGYPLLALAGVAVGIAIKPSGDAPSTPVRRECLPFEWTGQRLQLDMAMTMVSCLERSTIENCLKLRAVSFCERTWAAFECIDGVGCEWIACSHASPAGQRACVAAGWGR